MTNWTAYELETIGNSDELQLASLQENGTLGNPVTIWVVRVGSDLFVRSFRGAAGKWYQGTRVQREGLIRAGGIEKKVGFVDETDSAINDQIDAAYRAKYGHYPAEDVDPMVLPLAKSTSLKLVPQV